MQPGAISTEQNLACSCSPHCLFQEIKTPHAGSIGMNVWMAYQVIDQGKLRTPVIRETSQMRNDEVDIRIFFGEQLDHRYLTGDVVEHRQRELPRALANLACDRRVVTMHLDSHEAVLGYRFSHHRSHSSAVTLRMKKSETIKTLRSTANHSRHFAIGLAVVGMKCGKQYGAIDACPGGAKHIFFQRCVRVPRTR